ncbi:MAG: hypothetical protein CUN49_10715 [Candidatus Thermofonsia Clade 1 bacterium]|uniref:NADP oxidoreductase n=1 Tax=Candidatus Thermofonsia Clade 1 bacterium TaxID=2364210 RepID=A0A2M8PCY2_9CHLR|nr:MAG: hypothetical protein CUN49_10715 [Candidatus Thermofonsia Clade 1 bacterium]RMF51289.1 MAG: hypothetical protein D6749_08300 [Chloroflexota bacterium]
MRNVLQPASDGSLRPKPTDETFTIPVGLVFRSIGYKGVALPDLPFDERSGVMPNVEGRVIADGQVLRGVYCAGWIKRGATGVIGTNKPDSVETVNQLLNDLPDLPEPANAQREAIPNLLAERGVAYVTFSDWQRLDQIEIANGQAVGRPRLKFSRISEMLEVLAAHKSAQVSAD